jgi:hypothetical protein
MGNCVCSCSFNHAGYETSYAQVTIKEKVLMESPRKFGANFLGRRCSLPGVRCITWTIQGVVVNLPFAKVDTPGASQA